MSAAATADKNLALILEMGGDQSEGYDPIPPAQYLAFLNKDLRITPSAQEMLAWLRKWTIRARKGGRTPYAADGPNRPLRLKDAGEELKWQPPQVSKVWGALEDAGLVRKDEKDRLFLCGKVTPRRKLHAADLEDENEYEGMTEHEKFCCEMLPHYAWRQFRRLPPELRRRAAVEYWEMDVFYRRVKAEAMAGARDAEEEAKENLLRAYGVSMRRHDRKAPKTAEAPRNPVVKVQVIGKPELTVQNFSAASVQATNDELYTAENGPVQGSYPYEAEIDREDRVSKYETEPESVSREDHLPTPQDEEHETETPAPALELSETIEAKTLPVDKAKSNREADPVVSLVEKLFGRINPTLRAEFSQLAPANQIPPEAAARFVFQKVEDKITQQYPIKSAGALLQFCKDDIQGWILQNRGVLARTATREAPAAEKTPIDPADELDSLQITLEAIGPNHAQAPEFRSRYDAIRHTLEVELADCLDSVALRADEPDTPRKRERIEKLKRVLCRRANGAGEG